MRPLPSFWRDDKGLSALLICLVATLFVAPPLIREGMVGPVLFDLFFSLVLVSGVASLSHRRAPTVLAGILAALAVSTRFATFFSPSLVLARAAMWLAVLSLLVLTVLTLAQVFRSGEITTDRIAGAIAAYLLLGFTWALGYNLILTRYPGAFHFPDSQGTALELLYFSFVTLTTVGYGDITPVAPIARSLAASEALIGQLFPAILIARLVSMEISGRERRHRDAESDSKK